MSAIILGWDPAGWNRWNFAAVVEQVAVTGLHLEPWTVSRSVAAGTDVWLLLLGDHGPGLIGHGVVLSDNAGQCGHHRAGSVRCTPAPGRPGARRILTTAIPDVVWDAGDIAGTELAPGDEAAIRALWADSRPAARNGPHPACARHVPRERRRPRRR